MNKQDLVNRVTVQSKLPQKQSAKAVNAMLDSIVGAVSAGEPVKLSGFGTFDSQQRQSRRGRHPQTGATLQIPAKTVPVFSASRLFKTKVATQLYVLRIPPLNHRPQKAPSHLAVTSSADHHLRSITDRLRHLFNRQSVQNR